MKKALTIIILSLVFSVPAMAADLATGAFDLYSKPHFQPQGFCDRGVRLVLDKTELQGGVAFLENFLNGVCEIFVPANPRHYKITSVEDDGCGSKIYKGTSQGARGEYRIEIVDNRGRLCENVIPALIVVTERGPDGEHTLYSHDK